MTERIVGKRGLLPQRQGSDRFPIRWAHDYLAAPLPAPTYPVDVRGGAGPGQMWGNDAVGDCGEAGVDFIELYTAWRAQVPIPQTSTAEAEARYFAFTGGQDTGVVLADFLLWLYQHGYIKAFAPAPHTDRLTCDSLMQQFGTPLYCGVSLYPNSEQQFGAGQVWDPAGLAPDTQLGHCIDKVFSDGTNREEWRTWAQFQPAVLGWGSGCLTEAWVVITKEEQLARFTPQLLADLNALPNQTGGVPLPPPPTPVCVIDTAMVSTALALLDESHWTTVRARLGLNPPVTMTGLWLKNAAQRVALAFIAAFLAPVIAAGPVGAFRLSTAHAALGAGIVAAAIALEALIANVVQPTQASIIGAVAAKIRSRRVQGG